MRWLVCRLAALLILRRVGIMSVGFSTVVDGLQCRHSLAGNGSGLGVRAGFLAQTLMRRTNAKFSTNFHTKHISPPDAKPLLPAGVFVCPFLVIYCQSCTKTHIAVVMCPHTHKAIYDVTQFKHIFFVGVYHKSRS